MMNNEEVERKMAFIVDQQAQCVVDREKLHVAQEKLYESQRLTEQKLQESIGVVTRLAYVTNEGFKDVNAKINALLDSQIQTEETLKELTDSQKQTEKAFRRLIDRLNRRFDNGGDNA